ncbi:MAG: hypothetical protein HC829_06395, partial [Bacteroidales bacterium]|nr:hypothetical protein [Bacteroidales bacterium]
MWAPAGERPIALGHHRFEWLYVTAFVAPVSGEVVWFLSNGLSYGFRLIKPSSRIPIAEKSLPTQGFFGETVSGILKGLTGNRIKAVLCPI